MVKKDNIPPFIYALVGLIIYGACGFFSLYTDAINYIKMLSVAIIIWAFFKSPLVFPRRSRSIIKIFTYCTIFILFRGTLIGNPPIVSMHELTDIYGIVRFLLINEYSALSFFFMLFVLVPFDYRELKYYRIVALSCGIICLFNIYLFKDELFSFGTFGRTSLMSSDGDYLSIRMLARYCFVGLGAVLLFSYGIKDLKKEWYDYLLIFVIILYGMTQVAGGGRGGSVTVLINIIFLIYFLLKYREKTKKGTLGTRVFSLSLVVFIIYGTYYLLFVSGSADYLFSRMFSDGEFGGELTESNRTTFVDALIQDLNEHPWAWIIGKGCNGSYEVQQHLRSTIEWGYWYLILKGGVIYLFLYVYMLLKSFYVGFFKSNNYLVKAMAVLCLMCVVSLIPFGIPGVSLDYILVWHYVHLINTDEVLKMSDNEIRRLSC